MATHPRIGDVIATGVCKNCGRAIQHEFWGNGGTSWTHTATGGFHCVKSYAEPVVDQ